MKRYTLMGVALVLITPGLAVTGPAGTDPLNYAGPAWSPYLVGALIGLLSMATFYFSAKPLGASSASARDLPVVVPAVMASAGRYNFRLVPGSPSVVFLSAALRQRC